MGFAALEAEMLPYGSIYYHGSLAVLSDIPLGTHLRGLFYKRASEDKTPPPEGAYRRGITPDVDFRRCFRIEDNFSFSARQKQLWKIESVSLAENKLTARLHQDGQPVGDPKTFEISSATRIFQGRGIVKLDAIRTARSGTSSSISRGPRSTVPRPSITDLWLDAEARDLATAQQRERNRLYIRDRGLPTWVSAVDDDQQEIVTVTLFNNVDTALFDELKFNAPVPKRACHGGRRRPNQRASISSSPSLAC